MENKVNLCDKFALFHERWQPRIVGQLNGQHVKIVKIHGEFVWHSHPDEDELFFVAKGSMTIRLRDRDDVVLNEGEFFIVRRGIEHQPVAQDEAWVMLFEPAGTLNTGDQEHNERSVDEPRWI